VQAAAAISSDLTLDEDPSAPTFPPTYTGLSYELRSFRFPASSAGSNRDLQKAAAGAQLLLFAHAHRAPHRRPGTPEKAARRDRAALIRVPAASAAAVSLS